MVPVRQHVAKPMTMFAVSPAYVAIELPIAFLLSVATANPLPGIFFVIPFHLWAIRRTEREPDATTIIIERLRIAAARWFGVRAIGYPFPVPRSPYKNSGGSYVP